MKASEHHEVSHNSPCLNGGSKKLASYTPSSVASNQVHTSELANHPWTMSEHQNLSYHQKLGHTLGNQAAVTGSALVKKRYKNQVTISLADLNTFQKHGSVEYLFIIKDLGVSRISKKPDFSAYLRQRGNKTTCTRYMSKNMYIPEQHRASKTNLNGRLFWQ